MKKTVVLIPFLALLTISLAGCNQPERLSGIPAGIVRNIKLPETPIEAKIQDGALCISAYWCRVLKGNPETERFPSECIVLENVEVNGKPSKWQNDPPDHERWRSVSRLALIEPIEEIRATFWFGHKTFLVKWINQEGRLVGPIPLR